MAELDPSVPLAGRIRFARELCDVVRSYRLHDISTVWVAVSALLSESPEARAAVFAFISALLEGHSDQPQLPDLMRLDLFDALARNAVPEDMAPRLKGIQQLTRDGRDLACIERQAPALLIQWLVTLLQLDAKGRRASQKDITHIATLLVRVLFPIRLQCPQQFCPSPLS